MSQIHYLFFVLVHLLVMHNFMIVGYVSVTVFQMVNVIVMEMFLTNVEYVEALELELTFVTVIIMFLIV